MKPILETLSYLYDKEGQKVDFTLCPSDTFLSQPFSAHFTLPKILDFCWKKPYHSLLYFKLLVSSDLSRTQDLSTWVFQRQIVKPDSQPLFSIAFSSLDKLQVLFRIKTCDIVCCFYDLFLLALPNKIEGGLI